MRLKTFPSSVLKNLSLFLVCAFQLSCSSVVSKSPDSVIAAVEQVREEFCPDRRLCVFDVDLTVRGSNVYLKGEADEAAAINALIARAKEAANGYKVEVDVQRLPNETVGSDTFGVAKQSVVSMRSKPTDSSELVNQILLGQDVKLLKKEGDWHYAQTNDGYLGWIYGEFLIKGDERWLAEFSQATRLSFTEQIGKIYAASNDSALALSEIAGGGLVAGVEENGDWMKVQLPDDRAGFIHAAHLDTAAKLFAERAMNRADLVAKAKGFLGQPYLWGGNSPKGFDCSGFTQTVFKWCGKQLLRDASQQVRQGAAIEPGSNFENLLPGDLLFFESSSGRVNHVGIYIGDQKFIHSSGRESVGVTINSLNSNSPIYSEYRRNAFHSARRVGDFQS